MSTSRPLPLIDDATRFFWEGARQHRLMMLRCPACGRLIHHPRPVCPRCLSDQLVPEELSGRGAIYTHTVTEQAFHPFWADRVPYVVVVVELDEQPGLRFLSELVDCPVDDVEVGMPVEVVWEKVTEDVTLPLFRPAVAANHIAREDRS